MITLTYGFGVGLAAFAGVMAAPIYSVSPLMGADLIIVVFAVVVIGGMGSIMGSIVTGFVLGLVEGLTKVFYPEASNTVIFIIMAIVLMIRPAGLFGAQQMTRESVAGDVRRARRGPGRARPAYRVRSDARVLRARAGRRSIPVFLMKVMCFALFACAFNLLLGYVGLLSFGHAMFLGMAGYTAAHAAKVWGLTPGARDSRRHAARRVRLGLVSGLIAIRRQGIYFAMITLALAQMIYFFCLQAPFTHGEDGIQAVPRGDALRPRGSVRRESDVRDRASSIFLGGLSADLSHHPFAVRPGAESDPRERAARDRRWATTLTATSSSPSCSRRRSPGVAGATNALVFQLAALNAVHWTMSGEVVLMTLVGGLGTVFGPVVGALVVLAMENYLAQLGAWVTIVQGAIFVVCVLRSAAASSASWRAG